MRKSIIVTGAAGRVGRMLRSQWGQRLEGHPIFWSARTPAEGVDLAWNIGTSPAPALPSGAVILHLAGQTRGTEDELAENRRATAALCAAAQNGGVGHVFLMSSVAVYRPQPAPIDEEVAPQPSGAYGRAKLAAETAALAGLPPDRLTILRLGNLAGADSLLTGARQGPVLLDPIAGQAAGPVRSYIGPQVLAHVLQSLILEVLQGRALPQILNIAQTPALNMADLLQASGADWRFGPVRPETVPCVAVSVSRLAAHVLLPPATATGIAGDLHALKGIWP